MINTPSMSFEEALQIAKGMWDCSSGQKVRRLTLFDHLGKSPDSGPSRSLVTASSKYGLTSGGYQAEFIELTELGARASDPDESEFNQIQARFQLAIQNNEYFNSIYERYKNMKVPTNQVLEDCARELGLEGEEIKRCIETFIINAKYIGLIQVLSGAERLLSKEHLCDEHLCENNSSDINFVVNPKKQEECVNISDSIIKKTSEYDNICFYITPIGADGSVERKHSDLMLESIVAPALEEHKLNVIRADQINKPGMITTQILDYIIKSKLVIADLSFHNPNVFYELAIRHSKGLPTVHIIRSQDKLPFDISNFRTITLDMTDIYTLVPRLESYKAEISSYVRNALESPEDSNNPITEYLRKSK